MLRCLEEEYLWQVLSSILHHVYMLQTFLGFGKNSKGFFTVGIRKDIDPYIFLYSNFCSISCEVHQSGILSAPSFACHLYGLFSLLHILIVE